MPKIERETNTSGLFTRDRAPVPLTGVSVEAEMTSFCARISVTQRYVNREATPVEAVYVFPLDEGAAVCGFEAIVDDTVVVGEVKERDEAFRSYDEALERGDGAFLLDEERPDVFQASVGNLPPGKAALLKLTYVTELSVADGGLRFSVPTTVSPRYAPAVDRVGVGRPDSEALNPPRAFDVPYGLNLSIRMAMPGAISHVESPSHPVSVSIDGHSANVTLSQREVALDRDFVLSVQAASLDVPQAWIERHPDHDAHAVAIAFVPTLGVDSVPTEVIFVVDRSGSMGGSSIEEVRNALQLCLRSMVAGCRFNIVGFGSAYESLFPASRDYDERSLQAASEHVAGMQANLGGTEMLPALTCAFEQKTSGELTRQVVVLTDGEVTNTDAVIALAKQHAARARVFTFGIGMGASHHLVHGLARAGGGSAEFIHPGERIERKVVRQFARLLSPALTDVRIEWGTLTATQAPSVVPPVFTSGRLLVYGLDAASPADAPSMVRLSATAPTGPMHFDVPVDFSRAVDGRTVSTLAARARIRELEESPEWALARGSRQRDRKAESVTREIVALSVRYGLISRETSFVAVERRDTPVRGDIQLRRIPIALTAGWGDLQRSVLDQMVFGAPHPARAAGAPAPAADASAMPSGVFSLSGMSIEATRASHPRPTPGFLSRTVARLSRTRHQSAGAPPSGMHALIALQRADGSWDLTPELAAIIGHDMRDLETAIRHGSGPRRDVRRAWATALALVWLTDHASDAEAEWRLLAGKARKFLDATTALPSHTGTWLDAARDYCNVRSV
jgi:Ca-activated chloride channel family protein